MKVDWCRYNNDVKVTISQLLFVRGEHHPFFDEMVNLGVIDMFILSRTEQMLNTFCLDIISNQRIFFGQ